MKVKTHKEIIYGHNTVTFYIEDASTNTLIHSDTFIVTKKTKIKELKYNFVSYVQDKERLELSLLQAEVHKLTVNAVTLDLDKISSNNSIN